MIRFNSVTPRRTTRFLLSPVGAALVVTVMLSACTGAESSAGSAGSAASATSSPGSDEVLARIDGEPVTMADVEDMLGEQLDQMEFKYRLQRHQLIERALERVVRRRLLETAAEASGVSGQQLLEEQVGPTAVSPDEVEAWYRENAAALGGRSLEELRPRIRQFLVQTKRERALEGFAEELEEDRNVEYLLEPFRVELNNEGSPATGPEDAPITLVEFSDFECPFCGRFFPTYERIKQEYGDRLRIVFRQYPLREIHPNAYGAALASLCAHEQGRFWEMHDLMFQEQDRLDRESLQQKAGRLGLDTERFNECMQSQRYAEQIQRDLQAGDRVGVDGTPALFVNGIPVPGGAVPYDVLANVIEEELSRQR